MPPSPLFVRDAVAEDAEALSAVGSDSFLAAYGDTGDPHAIAEHVEALFGPGNIEAEMAKPECDYKIAMIGSIATGLVKLRSGNVPETLGARRVLELQQLYVHSDYQGYGIGRALIDAAVRYARAHDYEAIWLQTWSQADWAIPFYERNLFRRVGEIPYHLGDYVYEDWLMLREL
ncbi:MAG: N-acetyltransferase [Woeseiaceae bacterium]|jgi:ribosomal protein S18 acetylase RimI-like enzyme|nr:N-acetyltransferase [Woeseiaceae bacterium]